MIGFEFDEAALAEMIESAAFYEGKADGLGERFLDDAYSTIRYLRLHPGSGKEVRGRIRIRHTLHFHHSIVYSIEPDFIFIIAVAHQAQEPDYWRDRIPFG